MKTITVEIQIKNIDKWDVDWDKQSNEELRILNNDIKVALYEKVGINLDSIHIVSKLNQ
jgi:hypothetical protein